MRVWLVALLLLVAGGAWGQLPEAPRAVPKPPMTMRPGSVSVGSYEKYAMGKGTMETVVQASVDWRVRGGRMRMGMVYGHAMRSGDDSLSVAMTVKVWQFGR